MSHKIVSTTLTVALAPSGTFVIGYPAGTGPGHYTGGLRHKLATSSGNVFSAPQYFTLTFGAASITVNWGSGSPTLPVGTVVYIQLDLVGYKSDEALESVDPALSFTADSKVKVINLGSPITLDADGICVAQAIAGAANASINGALASGGAADLDVPRSLQMVSTNVGDTTQTVTVTSTDVYGRTVKETRTLNGTTPVLFQKAHKRVTQVAVSAALAGNLSVGTTDVLGLSVFVPNITHVLKEVQDATVATAGVLVGGVMTNPSASTGDVRGTYDPNAACNGALSFKLIVALSDPDFLGLDQYAG